MLPIPLGFFFMTKRLYWLLVHPKDIPCFFFDAEIRGMSWKLAALRVTLASAYASLQLNHSYVLSFPSPRKVETAAVFELGHLQVDLCRARL